MSAKPGDTVHQHTPGGWQVGSRGQEFTVPHTEPRHYLHQRHEYRDGFVTENESMDHYVTASEALEQRAARLKEHGVPYAVDGLTLTYEDVTGRPPELHRTVTLTWRDA